MFGIVTPARQAIATPSRSRCQDWLCRDKLCTTTRRKDDPIRTDRFHFAALFIESVNAEATIFRRKAKFRGGD